MRDVHEIHSVLSCRLEEARQNIQRDPVKAYSMAEAVRDDAQLNNLITMKGHALHVLTLVCRVLGQQRNAFENVKEAIRIFTQVSDGNMLAELERLLGVLHYYAGEYKTAQKQFYRALELATSVRNYEEIVRALNSIGEVFRKSKNYPEALRVYKEGVTIGKQYGIDVGVGRILSNMGEVYTVLGSYNQALETYEEAWSYIAQSSSDILLRFEWHYRKGKLQMQLGHYEKARKCIEKSEALFKSIDNKYYLLDALLLKYDVLIKLDCSNEALQVLDEAENISKQCSSDHQLCLIYEKLYMHFEERKMFEKALEMYKRYHYTLQKIKTTNLVMKLKALELVQQTAHSAIQSLSVKNFIRQEIEVEEERIAVLSESMERMGMTGTGFHQEMN